MTDIGKEKCIDMWGSAIAKQWKLGKTLLICYSIHKEFLTLLFNRLNLHFKYSNSQKYVFLYFSRILPFHSMIETIYAGYTYYKKKEEIVYL